jgi:phage/plasmid-like protein (TIGR03299 family)
MAHNLDFSKGKAAMFSVKEKPWHGLGRILDSPPDSKTAIIEAGLDYNVIKAPVIYDKNYHNSDIPAHHFLLPDRFVTYREDTGHGFGIVGSRYEVLQNTEAFEFFDNIVGEGAAIYETAGALNNGATVFITAKLPDYIRVSKEDVIEKYLLLTSTHDGTGTIKVLFTPIRVVCNNTLQAALTSSNNTINIRHTKSIKDKLQEAEHVLGITNTVYEKALKIYQSLTKPVITNDKQVQKYLDYVFLTKDEMREVAMGVHRSEAISTRKTNIMNDIIRYYDEGPGQQLETCRGTLYGAYNAVTGYFSNVKDYKSNEHRFTNTLFPDVNGGVSIMTKALNVAIDCRPGILQSLTLN